MKTVLINVAAILFLTAPAFAQDKPKAVSAEKATPTASPEQLEAKFKALLTKATMSGRWCSLKDGKLGPEKEDKYSIVSANRVSGDKWIISTRINFNKQEMVVERGQVTISWRRHLLSSRPVL